MMTIPIFILLICSISISIGFLVFFLSSTNLFGTLFSLWNKFCYTDLPESRKEILDRLQRGGFWSLKLYELFMCEVCQAGWLAIFASLFIIRTQHLPWLSFVLLFPTLGGLGYWFRKQLGDCKSCAEATSFLNQLKEARKNQLRGN